MCFFSAADTLPAIREACGRTLNPCHLIEFSEAGAGCALSAAIREWSAHTGVLEDTFAAGDKNGKFARQMFMFSILAVEEEGRDLIIAYLDGYLSARTVREVICFHSVNEVCSLPVIKGGDV